MNEKEVTSERIVNAFIELFQVYGYKGTTTRAIAEKAGVNEVTIFRHFGNKQGIIEAVVQKISFHPTLEKIISEEITWNLEEDLKIIAEGYHTTMENIKDIVLVGFRESGMFPELNEMVMEIPKQLRSHLVTYFTEMMNRGKLIETDIEFQAMNFIWMNFGYFLSKSRFNNAIISSSEEDFISNSVQLFARGLTP